MHGKQHPAARGEEGEEGSKPQAGVEHDGIRQRVSSRSPSSTVSPPGGIVRGLTLSRWQVSVYLLTQREVGFLNNITSLHCI